MTSRTKYCQKGNLDRKLGLIFSAAAALFTGASVYVSVATSDNLSKHTDPAVVKYNIENNRDTPEGILTFVEKHADCMREEAGKRNFPPEVIAKIFENENHERKLIDDLKDFVGELYSKDVSKGPAQFKTSTAILLDKLYKNPIMSYDEYDIALNSPKGSIKYVAMLVNSLLNGMEKEERMKLLENPAELARIYAAYSAGEAKAHTLEAKIDGDNFVQQFIDQPDKSVNTADRVYKIFNTPNSD